MTGPLPESARPLMDALAIELEHAGRKAHALTALIAHAVGAGSGADVQAHAVRDAQALDALIQHLEVLAEVSRRLSTGDRVEDVIEAAPLADVAARIGVRLGFRPEEEAPPAADGDLDLFD